MRTCRCMLRYKGSPFAHEPERGVPLGFARPFMVPMNAKNRKEAFHEREARDYDYEQD